MNGMRILAIDDDHHQLSALRRILRRSGFEVDTAANGRLGLRMAVQNPPDLILLDVAMPTMSGHQFLRRLRRLEKRLAGQAAEGSVPANAPEIPVIFVTAMAAPKQRVDGLDAGAVDYVTKPFDAEELRARIRSVLRRARREKEAPVET